MSKVLCLTLALAVLTLQSTTSQPQCQQGHLPFSGVCKPIAYVEGCAIYNPDNSCKVCEYGYQLSQGQCVSKSNDKGDCCASYGSDGTCLECSAGLYSADPYCSRNQIFGCILKKGKQCLVCGFNLSFYKGICIVPVDGCSSYNQAGVCVACKAGNKIVNNYCYPFPEVPNCQTHNQYGCIQCQNGYYLTTQKTCQPYQPGCLQYWQGQCITCLPLFLLYQGQCLIAGCKKYTPSDCAECDQGLTLSQGRCQENGCLHVVNKTCVKCRESLRLTPQGCVEPINYQCTSCAPGYQFYQGKCIKTIYGCLKYSTSSQCAQCATPFTLTINGECQILGCKQYCAQGCSQCVTPFILRNDVCVVEYCRKYNSNGCTTCEDGYLLINNICHPKDVNCDKYEVVSGKVECTSCVDGFFLTNGECIKKERGCWYNKQGKCTCRPPFVQKSGNCQLIGCTSYNWETCLSCYSPFQYNSQDKSCVVPNCLKYGWQGCLGCQDGWLLKDNVCVRGDPYCISYSQQGQCLACQSGFILSKGKCIRNIPNCQQLSGDQLSCVKCQNGFTLYKGECKRVIANCHQINYDKDYCTCCNDGYHLKNGECAVNDPNCLKYSERPNQPNQYCSQCKDYFFFDPITNTCQPKAPGCVYTGCDCTSCVQPFNYDASRKVCWIPGCQKYSYSGCQQCNQPFKPANNVCVIDYCLAYAKDSCERCQQGYAVSQQGLCVKINPNCLAYEGTQCIKCRDGFTLLQGNCVVQDENCVVYGQNGVICTTCNNNYHPDPQGKCQPDSPGCNYENGVCVSCCSPFSYHPQLKDCQIPNCQQANSQGCIKCQPPFSLTPNKLCAISYCLRVDASGCVQCKPQFHLNNGGCVADSPNCRVYSPAGVCELCVDKYVLSSNGQCVQGSRACISYSESDKTKCLQCGNGYFLNRFFQCEKEDGRCEAYTNGVCSKCAPKYFLFSDICFPYTKGCVQYSGKDCTVCRNNYVLKNGECFNWQPAGMALLGGADRYDFEINPIDVRQSKYYIDNLSPASTIGKVFFSSSWDSTFQDCSLSTLEGASGKGWKAKSADQNQFIGVTLSGQPATFYALQLEAVDGSYIRQFYIEYSTDGSTFIRVQTPFTVSSSVATNMTTIYFTGLYAKAIRIRITSYNQWPACRIEFFYYDLLRFRKISNLKSLTYLQETISSNFVDRVDNQIFINQVYFFNPSAQCSLKDLCFTGLQLCEPKIIRSLTLTFESPSNYITEFYLTYSVDGRSYNCFQNCKGFKIDKCTNNAFSMKLDNMKAQGVRIYPKNYQGSAKFSPTFFYE